MSEPIKLKRAAKDKDNEEEIVTAYGPHQAAAFEAQGFIREGNTIGGIVIPADDLTRIANEKQAAGMAMAGLVTFRAVANAPTETLAKIPAIGPRNAAKIKAAATELT